MRRGESNSRSTVVVAAEALVPLAALVFLSLAAALPVTSQTIPPDSAKPLPYLLDVGDAFALVRYSPGALDRASHVQHRFALLAEDFQRWSGGSVGVGAVLLSRTDWEALDLNVPYGLPARLTNGEVALSAWGDLNTVRLWRRLLGGPLPLLDGHPLYGSRSEASSLLLTDLLAQGVAARSLLERAGFRGAHPDVLNFTAHVVALAASHRHERLSLGEIERVYSVAPPDPSSSDPDGNDIWRFRLSSERPYFRAAEALIAKRGAAKAPKAMLKLLRKNGASLTPREVAERFPEVSGLLPRSSGTGR